MKRRFVPILIWTTGLLAFVGSSFVLYNFVVNDWRLEGDILSPDALRSVLGGKSQREDSTRLVGWEFALRDSASVTIDATLCNISIVPTEGAMTEIRIALSGDAVDTARYHTSAVSSDPAHLTLSAHPSSGWTESTKGLVEIEIAMPRHARLGLRLREGDLRIDRLAGDLRLEMSKGRFAGTDLRGALRLRNGSGIATLERCDLAGTIELGSGTAEMLFNDGDLHVVAPDGINARSHFGTLDAATMAGEIFVELIGNRPASHLRSESGMIVLKVLPGAKATIAASTELGILTHSLPLDIPDSVALATPGSLFTALNGGGDSIVVASHSGTIVLGEYGDRVRTRTPEFRIDSLPAMRDSMDSSMREEK